MRGFDSALLNQMPSLNILHQISERREIWSSPLSDIQEAAQAMPLPPKDVQLSDLEAFDGFPWSPRDV